MIEGEVQRKGAVNLDDELKLKIRETLLMPAVSGNISACATLLGLAYGTVHSYVKRHPEVAALCPEVNAEKLVPTELSIMDREPPPGEGLLPKDQAAMMKSMLKQNDRAVRKGWRDFGLADADADAMDEAEKRAQMPIGRIMAASEGGIIQMLARSTRMLDKLGEQLVNPHSAFGPLPDITDMAGSDKTELEYMKVFQTGVKTHIDLQTVLIRTRAATIDAMKKLKELAADRSREEKGVFEVKPKTNAEAAH